MRSDTNLSSACSELQKFGPETKKHQQIENAGAARNAVECYIPIRSIVLRLLCWVLFLLSLRPLHAKSTKVPHKYLERLHYGQPKWWTDTTQSHRRASKWLFKQISYAARICGAGWDRPCLLPRRMMLLSYWRQQLLEIGSDELKVNKACIEYCKVKNGKQMQ